MECRSLTQAVNDKLLCNDQPQVWEPGTCKSMGSMTDGVEKGGGGEFQDIHGGIHGARPNCLDESGNLMDDVKIGGVIAGGVIAAGMKVAPKKYRKKVQDMSKKIAPICETVERASSMHHESCKICWNHKWRCVDLLGSDHGR